MSNSQDPRRGIERRVPYDQVILVHFSADPCAPWRGNSPLVTASSTSALHAAAESGLRNEAAGAHGYLLPSPTDGDDATIADLKTTLRTLKGKTAIVETMAGNWQKNPASESPRQDWKPQRLGFDAPDSLLAIRNPKRSRNPRSVRTLARALGCERGRDREARSFEAGASFVYRAVRSIGSRRASSEA